MTKSLLQGNQESLGITGGASNLSLWLPKIVGSVPSKLTNENNIVG